MKICYLVYSFYLSGAEKLVYSLATQLGGRYQVIVGGLYEAQDDAESARIMDELENHGVRTLRLGKRKGSRRIQTIWRLTHILRAEKVDILHTHTLLPNFYGRVAASLAGVPIRIATMHSGGNDWINKKGYWMERLTRSLTTRYVAVSKIPAKLFERTFGTNSRLTIIPNGIDIGKFQHVKIDRNVKRRSLGLSPTDTVLINVGRVNPAKGQEYLIEAMRPLTERYPNLRLLVVGDTYGDPKLVERLKCVIDRSQLGKHVLLLGSRVDIPELLALSDIFVFPSLHEAQGIALLEAMAEGLPVVASRIAAIQEILENGKEGLLVSPRDPEAIADAVSKLIADPTYAKELARAAQKKVRERYSIESTVAAYENLYEQLFSTVKNRK